MSQPSIRYHRHAATQINEIALLSATVELTDAQTKALPTTGIEIVAAPGAGQVVIPVAVIIATDTNAAAYTNIGADAFMEIGTDAVSWCYPAYNESGGDTFLSALLGVISKEYVTLNTVASQANVAGWGVVANALQRTQIDNKALRVKITGNSGNLTGGNVANTLRVNAIYTVIDL